MGTLKNILVILSVFVALMGCDKKAELKESHLGIEMLDLPFEIKEAKEVPWRVGTKLRKVVSRGVTVTVKIPAIDEDDINMLYQRFGVDSWVVKVTYIQNSKKIELGSMYAPFKKQRTQRSAETTQVKTIAFSLTYAASALSERFRLFNCPAFGHNKRVTNVQIIGENSPKTLVVQTGDIFNDKPMGVSLTPSALNVGHELRGEYLVDIALYRTKDRRLYSRLITLPQKVVIDGEDIMEVPECAGVHHENEPHNPKTIPFKSWK